MKNFIFKGSRKYIHVTDIYNNLILKKNYRKLSIIFKKKLCGQPRVVIQNSLKKKIFKEANCIINIYTKNNNYEKILIYETKKKINDSYHYDEKLFYRYFKIKKKSSFCNFNTSMSSIEVLIAITKYFHEKRIKNCNWFFTRLKLEKKINEKQLKNFSLYLKKNYINKFTVSEIYQNKKYIGEIEFSKNNND